MSKSTPETLKAQIRANYEHERQNKGVARGACFCGCGLQTPLHKTTATQVGNLKGEPRRFIKGHQSRLSSSRHYALHRGKPIPQSRDEYITWYEANRPEGVAWGECWCGCQQAVTIPDITNASYGRFRGLPMRFVNSHRTPLNERYQEQDRGHDTPCWIWSGGVSQRGYGTLSVGTRSLLAHRFMYERAYGYLPEYPAFHLHHLCEQRLCCRPSHLLVISPSGHVRLRPDLKLTEAQVVAIREERALGKSVKALARVYDVDRVTISNITRNKSWRGV